MKKILLGILATFFGLFIMLAFLPKFLIIDNFLMKNKVFILPEAISEGLLTINLKKSDVYYQDKQLIKKADINLYVLPLSQGLTLICNAKKSEIIHKTFGGFVFNFDNFKCSSDFENVSGKFEIKDGINGKLKLENFNVQGRNVEFLEFTFKGKTFEFRGSSQGINVSGNGIVSFDEKNPLNSKINGTASAVGFNFVISGTITNPQFNMQ
ncbi:MAG: hypothetical protein C0198_00620 [Sulfurihydrogenibium sp.]|nr:MAG: hypothetical protein C0198_00620 [Sulfurihydrogenibium sp.]